MANIPNSTPFKSMLRTPAQPEVIYQYNDGMARMKMLSQICLLWLREHGDEGDDENDKIQYIQDSADLLLQLLSSKENQIQNLQNYTNQKPDRPPAYNPFH